MMNKPFSPWPSFSEEEADAVKRTLLSNKVNYWTGLEGRQFEQEFAVFSNCKYAIALANGTVAIDLAFKALDLGKGDEVIVTSRTFLASVSCIVNAGAIPIFADVDITSQNITADTITPLISKNTKAILCVHLAGWPCDMDPIMSLASEHELFVIEDCAQAHGAIYKGRSVGSIGHVGCWSFCQDKIMTTGGEGGMVTTNDGHLWSRMWEYKDHGKSWEAVYQRDHPPGFRWLHETFGTNWRMTEMQAVIGRIQLKKIHGWQQTRFNYAQKIWSTARETSTLTAHDFRCSACSADCKLRITGCRHAAYKCYVFVKGSEKKRDEIQARINEKGVPCFSGSCSEVYLEKAFDYTDFRPMQRLAVARKLGETSLMFLCHPTLTQSEIDTTCQVLKEAAG